MRNGGRFVKGNKEGKGRPKGSKDKKTLQWEAIGEYLSNEGAERYLQSLIGLEDEQKFRDEFRAILEYFKPKQQRTQIDGKLKSEVNIIFDKEDADL